MRFNHISEGKRNKRIKMVVELIHVDSPKVSYGGDQITVDYQYATTSVKQIENRLVVSVCCCCCCICCTLFVDAVSLLFVSFSFVTRLFQVHNNYKRIFSAHFEFVCLYTLSNFAYVYYRKVSPENVSLTIATDRNVPKLGLMLVGWGGNNGSTITAALEANRNKLEWRTKNGMQKANWFGSITQASTVLLGSDSDGKDVYVPMNRLVPMVDPDDIGSFHTQFYNRLI